jgi:hypothetical protein
VYEDTIMSLLLPYERNALTSLRRAVQAKHEDARESFVSDALRYMTLALEAEEKQKCLTATKGSTS